MKTIIGLIFSILIVSFLAPMVTEGKIRLYPTEFFIGSLIVVGFISLLTVLPIYIVLASINQNTLKNILVSAFLIGFISIAILLIIFRVDSLPSAQPILVENGSFTLAGWLNVFKTSFLMGCSSMLGAMPYWAIAVRW